MKIRILHVGSILIGVALIAGCATRPVPTDRLSRVAIITSGNTNLFSMTKLGPVVSIVEVDGKPASRSYGPIELEPGTHAVTMKCGKDTKIHTLSVLPGEVYQFAVVTTPGTKGCTGSLTRVRSASPAVVKEAEKAAQAERAKAELAKKEQLAREQRAKAEQLAQIERARAESARAEPAMTVPARRENAAAGPVVANDQRDVAAAIASWADAWSRKDLKDYFAAYATNFEVPSRRSRQQWEAQRRARIAGKSRIEVTIEGLETSIDGNVATARFRQHYRSNTLTETSGKTLVLVKTGQKWLIQQERN